MSQQPRLALGTCPDSWGVWYADDPRQTPWDRFLDEVAEVGYEWLELGPYGYLPTDPARLADEVGRRRLKVAGGTMHGASGLHRAADWPGILAATRRVAGLTAAVGGEHLVFVPVPGYRDDETGAFLEPAELTADEWRTMTRAADELGKVVAEVRRVLLQAVAGREEVGGVGVVDDVPVGVQVEAVPGALAVERGDDVVVVGDAGDPRGG